MNKTKKIILKAKKNIFSEKIGNNPSIFKGEGYDFVELREYQIGDDIRKIDWNITAKANKPFVKIFQEERELNIVAVSILNSSVYFGSQKMKQDIIAETVSLIGFSAVKNMDSFSSYIFGDLYFTFHKPTKKSFGIEKVVESILTFNSIDKKVEPQFIIDTLIKKVKKRSMIFIISDFYTPLDFKYLGKHSEIISIIVRDKLEENPEILGEISLVDSENGKVLEGDFSNTRNYQNNLKIHDKKILQDMKKAGVRTFKLYTDSNIFKEFRKFFG